MKLVYSRDGGLFPQAVQTEAKASDLPDDLQKLANDVLTNPDAYSSKSRNRNLRDGYQYRLDLQEGDKKASLTFDDLSVPEAVQPLLQFMQKQPRKS